MLFATSSASASPPVKAEPRATISPSATSPRATISAPDNIRDFGSYYRDSFNLEQGEILEDPAGLQFGCDSTGGVITDLWKLLVE